MARYGYAFDMTQNIQGHFVESIGTILEQGGNTLPDEYVAMFREVETEELLCPKTPLPIDALKYFSDVAHILQSLQIALLKRTLAFSRLKTTFRSTRLLWALRVYSRLTR